VYQDHVAAVTEDG
jgi:hypothetical protein